MGSVPIFPVSTSGRFLLPTMQKLGVGGHGRVAIMILTDGLPIEVVILIAAMAPMGTSFLMFQDV